MEYIGTGFSVFIFLDWLKSQREPVSLFDRQSSEDWFGVISHPTIFFHGDIDVKTLKCGKISRISTLWIGSHRPKIQDQWKYCLFGEQFSLTFCKIYKNLFTENGFDNTSCRWQSLECHLSDLEFYSNQN